MGKVKCVVCHGEVGTGQCFYCKPIDPPPKQLNHKTPEQIDKIVCEWSMAYGVAMSEQALNALVDALAV